MQHRNSVILNKLIWAVSSCCSERRAVWAEGAFMSFHIVSGAMNHPLSPHICREIMSFHTVSRAMNHSLSPHICREMMSFLQVKYTNVLKAYSHNGILKAGERYSVSRTFQYILWFIFEMWECWKLYTVCTGRNITICQGHFLTT